MTRIGYYSPLWTGAVMTALLLWSSFQEAMPQYAAPLAWTGYVFTCAAGGMLCQLALIGFQGAFAQVLPVPGGRSIRDRSAAISGSLLLACLGCGIASAVQYTDATEGMVSGGHFFALAAGACGVAAAIAYAWGLPTAVADFSSRE